MRSSSRSPRHGRPLSLRARTLRRASRVLRCRPLQGRAPLAGGIILTGQLPEGTVTILFTDVVGSTELTTRLGDEPALYEHYPDERAEAAEHLAFALGEF